MVKCLLITSSDAVVPARLAQATAAALAALGLLNGRDSGGTAQYFVSDDPTQFTAQPAPQSAPQSAMFPDLQPQLTAPGQTTVPEAGGHAKAVVQRMMQQAGQLKAALPEAELVVDSRLCAGVTPDKHAAALETMRSCQIDVR